MTQEEKRKYEPNIRNPIRREEIEHIRSRIQIGDVLPVEIQKIDLSMESMVPQSKVVKCRVVGKYKHVVEVEEPKTGRKYTTTYIEMLLRDRGT